MILVESSLHKKMENKTLTRDKESNDLSTIRCKDFDPNIHKKSTKYVRDVRR